MFVLIGTPCQNPLKNCLSTERRVHVPCHSGHFVAGTSPWASGNTAAQPQAWATSIAMHRSSRLYSSETPEELHNCQFFAFQIVQWYASERLKHVIHLKGSLQVFGDVCLPALLQKHCTPELKIISLSFLQGSRPNVIHPLWLPSIRFDCSSKYKDELCHLIFISSPTCVALLLWTSNLSWKCIRHYVVLLVRKLSWHLEVLQYVPNLS